MICRISLVVTRPLLVPALLGLHVCWGRADLIVFTCKSPGAGCGRRFKVLRWVEPCRSLRIRDKGSGRLRELVRHSAPRNHNGFQFSLPNVSLGVPVVFDMYSSTKYNLLF